MSFDLSWLNQVAQSIFTMLANALNALAQYYPVLIPVGIIAAILYMFRDIVIDFIRGFLPF